MAENVTLKLKAVLDTSDVKQQLNSLRQQQQAATSGGSSANLNSGNLVGLGATLNRLNLTLQQLSRSLMQGGSTIGNSTTSTGSPFAVSLNSSRSVSRALPQTATVQINEIITKITDKWSREMGKRIQNGEIKPDNPEVTRMIRQAADLRGTAVVSAAGRKLFPGWSAVPGYDAIHNGLIDSSDSFKTFTSRGMRPLAGLAAHQVFQSVRQSQLNDLNLANEDDYRTFRNTSIVGNALSYGMMGAAAGPYGMLAGVAAGTMLGLVDALTENTRALEAEVAETQKRAGLASQYKEVRADFAFGQRYDSAVRSATDNLDPNKLRGIRAEIEKAAEKNLKMLEQQDKLALTGDVADNAMQLQAEYAKQIAQLQQIDDLTKKIEETKKKEAEQAKKIADAEAKQLQGYKDVASKGLVGLSYEYEQTSNRKLIAGGASLTQLEGLYGSYGKQAGRSRGKLMNALEAASTAKTSEEAKKHLDAADKFQTEYEFNKGQAQAFNSAIISKLQEMLSNLKAPDMSNVNSLANQGYMTSKSDDDIRLQMQTDIQKQQLEIQKQIKDKIRESAEFG